jgi:hypothetical protein
VAQHRVAQATVPPKRGTNGYGHTAVYLTRVCVGAPSSLQRGDEGEHGVVISRYSRIGGMTAQIPTESCFIQPRITQLRGLRPRCREFLLPESSVARDRRRFWHNTPQTCSQVNVEYSRRLPDLEFVSLVVPQVPGTIRRSRPIRGIAESLLKAKKYVIPLAFFQMYVAGSFAAAYLVDGQFRPNKNAMGFNPSCEASVAVNQLGSEASMPARLMCLLCLNETKRYR